MIRFIKGLANLLVENNISSQLNKSTIILHTVNRGDFFRIYNVWYSYEGDFNNKIKLIRLSDDTVWWQDKRSFLLTALEF